MAEGLQDAWQRLTLTEDENTVVACDDESSTERVEQVALCLLGKLHTENSFNIGAMKTVMKNVWKPAQGVVIKELGCNLFIFQFFDRGDKEYVLNEGPWAFDGSVLLLKQMTGLEQPSEVVFDKIRFCVKAYDVPVLKQTYNFAQFLGTQVGDFVDCIEDSLGGISKTLNFRVDVDIRKPLRRGVKTLVRGTAIWIRLKYVKLPDFCYACGLLGHTYRSCGLFEEGMEEDELQYGSWLRASPLKSRRRNTDLEQQEEKRLLLAYRNRKEGGGVRTKLDFKLGAEDTKRLEGGRMDMMVDNEGTAIPSGAASKRRLLGLSAGGSSTTVRMGEGSNSSTNTSFMRAEVAQQPRRSP